MSTLTQEQQAAAPGYGSLRGRVALVTGSGRGLGRTIAETLMCLGADVALHDISETAPAQYGEAGSLTEVAQKLSERGTRVIGVTGDITQPAQVEAMIARVDSVLGPLDILVNCAGGDIGAAGTKPDPNGALDVSLADAQAVFQRNFMGTVLMCRTVVPAMRERGTGSVVNIGSLNGHQGVSPEVMYGCAKAAIVHYTRCLALEMRSHGVRVNCVSPGPTKSARFLATRVLDDSMMNAGTSLARYAEPQEIADVVAFLAGPNSSFISGQVLRVDGAASLYAA